MIFRLSIAILACLVPLGPGRVSAVSSEGPNFSVRFTDQHIEFSGRVDSEETALNLATAAHGARPDLSVINEGLVIDPATTLPPFSDLRSLIAELGLSTHEGRLEFWPDRVLIGGLTDSFVTLTALRIRLEPILGKRRFVNHICIVSTDFLPRIEVSLTSSGAGSVAGTGYDPASILTPSREMAFEMPGLRIEKLFPTLLMLSDFDRLEGKKSVPAGALRASPLELTAAPPGDAPTLATMLAATPLQQYESLPSVHFSRNGFLLQSNQAPVFDELTRYLLTPERKGRVVTIEAVKPSAGSGAFNDYLCEKRAAEVVRFLSERGVEAPFTIGVVNSASPIDEGEVRLSIEIPLLPVEPALAPTDPEAEKLGAVAEAALSGEGMGVNPGKAGGNAAEGLKPFSAQP